MKMRMMNEVKLVQTVTAQPHKRVAMWIHSAISCTLATDTHWYKCGSLLKHDSGRVTPEFT